MKIVSIVLGLAFALCLTGCPDKKGDDKPAAAASASAKPASSKGGW